MARPSAAHVGIHTRAQPAIDKSFESFCDRQRSRAAIIARTIEQRYVNRVLNTVVRDEEFDVTVKGYGIGGAPHRPWGEE